MRKLVFVSLVSCGLLAGCAESDKIIGYNQETEQVDPDAPVQKVQEVLPIFGPWGEIAAAIVGLGVGGYILVRKIQKKVAK
jgi:hypothetical protein